MEAIRSAIQAGGPITFAEFMELALYGPGGFYVTPPIGPHADFVTSPHVHPVFGKLLATAIRACWDRLGKPIPLHLTEVGAGDGTLAQSVLGVSAVQIRYTAVDRSAGARAALGTIEGLDVRERLTGPVDMVLCNELLDNLPFRLLRGGREVRIGMDGERLEEVLIPVVSEPDRSTAAGDDRIVPVGALAFIDTLAHTLERGYALLIDYGGLGTTGGPVHGYRDQAIVEDVLAHPGGNDITAGVDFDLIRMYAAERGLLTFASVTQRDALIALGLKGWLDEQLRWQQMQQEAGDRRDAVATWTGRSAATLLADPVGLGRLRWMLLATPGLEAPPWLGRAAARSGDQAPSP